MSKAKSHPDSIFGSVIEIASPEKRAAYLDEACGEDAELRRHLEKLLDAHFRAGNFLGGTGPALLATANQPITERAGTVIGPYKLLEQIGVGGFGIVFMAEQQQPVRRKVALKVIKPGMDTHQVIARFEAERQALALMDHPNIASVLDAGATASGRPYFVMELVKGLPISEYCDQNQLSSRQRLELFVHVCQAVQHAHQKGIIHRDIKPSNVLVTEHDGTPVVKVIDFGIAKATGQQLTEKTLFTNFAQMIGTPLYMSPEQAGMSGQDIDTRSDIYALGVLLYELLTGSTPFDKERLRDASYDEVRRIIREEEPAKPSTRISTLGQAGSTVSAQRQSDPQRLRQILRGDLDWIVMKALEKDRNRRYETANDFARDIQRYLHDEPVEACPPSTTYRLRKFARRNRRTLTAATVVGFALLLAVGSMAGSIGWVVRDQAERLARTQRDMDVALLEATEHLKHGKRPEASAAIERAAALVTAGADPDLRVRMEQLRADLKMVARLEEVRLDQSARKWDAFNYAGADPAYAAAFQTHGIDVTTLDPPVAAEMIRRSVIYDELVAALDDWVWEKPRADAAGKARLQTVLKLADPDPWRARFRDPAVQSNPRALKDLANQPPAAALPPSTVVLLGRALCDARAYAKAVEVLSAAQERHPSDFRLNTELATLLLGPTPLLPRQPAAAAGYFRAALAIRPQSPGAHVGLGDALMQIPEDLDKAIVVYQKAIELKSDLVGAHYALGGAHAKKGNWDAALAAYRKTVELSPNHLWGNLGLFHALVQHGEFEAASVALESARSRIISSAKGRNHSIQLQTSSWPIQIDYAKRLAALDKKLPAVLCGDAAPADAGECIGLAQVCNYKQLFGASARFYAEAFRTMPELQGRNGYAAACAAARAGCGQGKDDPPLDESARTHWRKQALDWLRTDLTVLTNDLDRGKAKAPAQVELTLQLWTPSLDLAGVRNADRLALLPKTEQVAWRKLWMDVDAVLQRARKKTD